MGETQALMMDLGFAGQPVVGTEFGFTVAIRFGGGFELRVETPFALCVDGFDREVEPGRHGDAPAVTQLTGHVVSLASADDSGGLRIDFAAGGRLTAGPDSSFEAWTVAGPHGFKVVCGPAGELSVWSPHND
ncbi:DUF6188 family protein [Paractinoplanes maris]|uniref:DUF6188 family protein n=1 Tax=Paractinoplanes maris TaxID=1734446 RepID=UPI002020A435|nr:DUF6188 family protein [Actinoplanes maris]